MDKWIDCECTECRWNFEGSCDIDGDVTIGADCCCTGFEVKRPESFIDLELDEDDD